MSIKYWLPLAALLCLQTPAFAGHSGSAPIDPSSLSAEPRDDQRFMVDTAPGLDTGSTFREGGPLTFKVNIDRYVGQVGSISKLQKHQTAS